MVSESKLRKIKKQLPYGYAELLQKRIEKKYKKKYSLGYIRKGLMHKHLNKMFLDETILFLEEEQKKDQDRMERLQNL